MIPWEREVYVQFLVSYIREQEEKETLETPEGNQIEVAGVETTLIEPEVDETEDYKENKYGKSTGSFGIKKNPSVAFIM